MKLPNLKNSLFNIRPVQQSDLPNLAEILAISFYCNGKGNFAAIVQWLYPFIRWSILLDLGTRVSEAVPNYVCLVAVQNTETNRAIATLEMSLRAIPKKSQTIHLLNWQPLQYPYIANLAVHPKWRRQGIASQLLESAEQTARRWGFKQIYLHVLENNHPARELYARLGYQFYRFDPEVSFWLWSNPKRLLLRKVLI